MNFPIVILHGWGRGADSFDALKKLLEEKGHLVYVFDLPGFGKAPEPPEPWAVSDYVNFVLHFAQSENLDKFYLFGHSFGGRVAIKFSARYPEKIAGLILCDAAGVTPRPGLRLGFFAAAAEIGNVIFSFPLLRPFYGFARKIIYFLIGKRDYYYLETETMRETFKKTVAEDLTPYLEEIKARTFVIWGRKDEMIPVSDSYIISKGIKGSELLILENVGHSPHLETPDKLAASIDNFIKKDN